MTERLKTLTPVRIKSGRHAGLMGRVEFYGVSRFDKKQPVVCVRHDSREDWVDRKWVWVRPELLEAVTEKELREYQQNFVSEGLLQ